MGYGGPTTGAIGEPWLELATTFLARIDIEISRNPADPPRIVRRFVAVAPLSVDVDNDIVSAPNFVVMRYLLEQAHNLMHGFVAMGTQHVSIRDPFVFLLHPMWTGYLRDGRLILLTLSGLTPRHSRARKAMMPI
jgi:hypothetical protein